MGVILYIIAYVLFFPLVLINWITVRTKKGYFTQMALNIDIFANQEFRATFNKYFRKSNGYKFGATGETISSALGKNQRDNTLTRLGRVICWVLDWLDKEHCKKSINLNINSRMSNKMITVEKEPTEEQAKAIAEASAILENAGLELIGTRPPRR